MPFVAFLVTAAYWPGIPSFAVAPRWAVISVSLPVALWYVRVRPTPAHWLGLALVAYAAASLWWTPVIWDGLQGLWFLLLWGAAFCLGAEREEMGDVYAGVALGLVPSAVLAVFQINNVSPVLQLVGPAGLFGNKNFMGEIAALALIGVAGKEVTHAEAADKAWPRRLRLAGLLLAPAVSLALSGSRASWLAVAVAAALWGWKRRPKLTAAAILAALVLTGYAVLSRPSIAWTLEVRHDLWLDTIDGMTWKGNGIGSFYVWEPAHATRMDTVKERATHAHDDPLELAYELGAAASLYLAVVVIALAGPREAERLVLAAFLVEGSLGFPLYNPATALVGALTAGCLCGTGHRLRLALAGGGRDGCAGRTIRWENPHRDHAPVARGGRDLSPG